MLKAYIPDYQLTVDVAITGEEIANGLSYRNYLGDWEGMLFIIQEPTSFWMKNMLIPIDIIFLNKNQVVVAILHNAQPCPLFGECPSYMPTSDFAYVLETISGFAEHHDIVPGTKMTFNISS